MPPGPTARLCVDVANNEWVESGDFIAGPFALYRASWAGGPPKTVWFPAHQSRFQSTPVTVSATPLGASGDSRIFAAQRPGFSRLFFRNEPRPVVMMLPAAGQWMLVATVGTNWGCFIVTLA